MSLTVIHYHFRPGGVRRVIEQGLPALVQAMGGAARVVLAAGEAPDDGWRVQMEAALAPCAVRWVMEPALGYWSEQTAAAEEVAGMIQEALQCIIVRGGVVWAHNLSVGRNMLLARALPAAAAAGTLLLHHHDWWWDGRWDRWAEMHAQDIDTFEEALICTVPQESHVRHICVNAADARRLRAWTGAHAGFLPNPIDPDPSAPEVVDNARAFLRSTTAAGKSWVYPCRGLRRKNIAEALLVQRWLAPDGVTVTTGGASSAQELDYFHTLQSSADACGWPLRTGVCQSAGAPPAGALLAAADAAVITSLKEGFGLPYHEAAAAQRPLVARIPHGLDETMRATGFIFRNGWPELLVLRDFYDGGREDEHIREGRAYLMALIPQALRATARSLTAGDDAASPAVDFGSLSLTAQLEILTQTPAATRGACLPLNPALQQPPAPQPIGAGAGGSAAWAEALWRMAKAAPLHSVRANWPREAPRFLAPLLREWLRRPLLWPQPAVS